MESPSFVPVIHDELGEFTKQPLAKKKKKYLNENAVWLRNSFEQIIGCPTDCDQGVPVLVGRHHVSEFDDAPGQHCGGECHRKPEFDVVAGVVVAAGEIRVVVPPVAQPRLPSPTHSLILWQESRSLSLEENNRLRQRVSVVVAAPQSRFWF